mgnify:FL=1
MIVTAAIIRNLCGEILICQRPENKSCPLLWEFPGGKLEKGETLQECLARECMEELGIEIEVQTEIGVTNYRYPTFEVEIHFFESILLAGTLRGLEHKQILWVAPNRFSEYDFCPADIEILHKLA